MALRRAVLLQSADTMLRSFDTFYIAKISYNLEINVKIRMNIKS